MKKLAPIYKKVLDAKYIHTENAGDYAIDVYGKTLYIYFQWSNGKEDWKNNFDFACVPYKGMPTQWKAHRGFVRVWKSLEGYIKDAIEKHSPTNITVAGYSHGAALTILCHEYIKFNYPAIKVQSYAFEAPRVFCGTMPDCLIRRWNECYVIRNGHDLITHLPPKLFGYKDVGIQVAVGTDREIVDDFSSFKCINEHGDKNVMNSLLKFDKGICC